MQDTRLEMHSSYKSALVVLVLFASSMLLTDLMTPKSTKLMDRNVSLEEEIPKRFKSWKFVETNKLTMVNPQDDLLVNKLYSQVLERTYVNDQGTRVLLSIAYGAEQRNDMLAHFPEVCYPAQGFNIDSAEVNQIVLLNKDIDVKQLVTQRGNRFEDVSYFVRVGEKLVATRSDQKWESIKYGVQGVIPDGLIFRVSTIGESEAFKVHQNFMNELFSSLDKETIRFISAGYFVSGTN